METAANTPRIKLVEARKKKGWTQEMLANKAGIDRAYLSNIENGKYRPSLPVAQKLSSLLGIPTDKLFPYS